MPSVPPPSASVPSDASEPDPRAHGPFAAIRRALPAGEVVRFLMVGVSNTVSSLAIYSAFVILFSHLLPQRGKPLIADIAFIVSTPIGITIAFLCYKHFVFHTHGNYLKEWLRCFAVYSVSFPVGLVILPTATNVFLHLGLTRAYAPFLAGIVNSGIIACYSYFAHKKFSFRR
ncbi:MAG TPA: GtrA family protein [Acidobacteriaceae bacterium]|jgi:putative flippase GtrA|nr:GtrA family protein [Acidobacteriaceae bacterium]